MVSGNLFHNSAALLSKQWSSYVVLTASLADSNLEDDAAAVKTGEFELN